LLGTRPLIVILDRLIRFDDRRFGLMVVCDFDVVGIIILPMKSYAMLIVDPDA
jgi:hypothetical protein